MPSVRSSMGNSPSLETATVSYVSNYPTGADFWDRSRQDDFARQNRLLAISPHPALLAHCPAARFGGHPPPRAALPLSVRHPAFRFALRRHCHARTARRRHADASPRSPGWRAGRWGACGWRQILRRPLAQSAPAPSSSLQLRPLPSPPSAGRPRPSRTSSAVSTPQDR